MIFLLYMSYDKYHPIIDSKYDTSELKKSIF